MSDRHAWAAAISRLVLWQRNMQQLKKARKYVRQQNANDLKTPVQNAVDRSDREAQP
jgi:hypothetical protein